MTLRPAANDPIVSVLLTHHLDENQPYLDRAITSVLRSVQVPFSLTVLSDAVSRPVVPEGVRLVWDHTLSNATKKVTYAIDRMNPKTKFVLLMSDDVIVSRTMLATLTACAGNSHGIFSPMSNSDVGNRFYTPLVLSRGDETRNMKPDADLEEYNGWEESIMNYLPASAHNPLLVTQDWISFFCVLIPMKTWDAVGGLDPALETRHNDQDFCMRANQKGIPSMINFSAFAFHYGTKTLKKSCVPGEQDEATKHFMRKWYGRAS